MEVSVNFVIMDCGNGLLPTDWQVIAVTFSILQKTLWIALV